MGLIKAAAGAAGGVLADQWKEFFLCEALPANVLAVKGQKKTTRRSSNTHGDENIITTGSRIAVADGQCMLIVEQGKVVEVCAEPGEYTYDASTEPSIFAGNLGESIGQVFRNIGKRFTFGGEAPKDQRIYYFNTKELTGNKYGTPSPVPFRVVDQRAGIDIDIGIRCFGEDSYHLGFRHTYAPGGNIHRTPYSGRNFEYYSEDALLSYIDSAIQTEAMAAKGCAGMVKHFCGNDQETNRHGVATFMNEQTYREVCLKGFEGGLSKGHSLGTMTAYNRIGCIPTASDYATMTQVLRKEWGFTGINMTDSSKDSASYMGTADALAAEPASLTMTRVVSRRLPTC